MARLLDLNPPPPPKTKEEEEIDLLVKKYLTYGQFDIIDVLLAILGCRLFYSIFIAKDHLFSHWLGIVESS